MPERSSDHTPVEKRARDADGGRRSGYHDFELEIGIGQGLEYPVAVLNSPAGQTRETMVFPYDEVNLDSRLKDLKVALLRSGGSRRQILTPEEAAVQGFGKDIFDALLSGEARSLYDMSVQQAREDGKGLRLKLRILPPELARLPWEFLYDDRHAEYVSLSRETPVVRFLESRRPTQPLSVTPPLQILGMIASPSDLPQLDTGRERKRVEQALARLESNGLVDLTWIENPTWRELQRAMRSGPWHVFHFIGHGGFDSVAGEGVVALADDDGRSHNLSATELGRLLADHNALRLAVLNSCEGAMSSDEDVFSSTAAVLVRRGIPAVLAMQYEITDRAAIEFARTFYESLADGYPVDGAVAEARKAVSLAVTNTIEWGTPVLFMRTADGVVFDLPAGPDLTSQVMPIDSGDDIEAERLDALYTEGLSAFWVSDWARALQRFTAITDIRPDYSDAATRLEEAQKQLRWSALLSEAADARASEDWPAAIAALQELQAAGAPFSDVADLLADSQRQQEVADLFSQAGQLEAAEHWPAAVNVLTKLRQLAPDSTDAVKMLARAQAKVAELERVAHLDLLYSRAVRAMDRGDWVPAKAALREILDTDPDYRDAAGLVVRCDAELRPSESAEDQPESLGPEPEPAGLGTRRRRLAPAIVAAIVVGAVAAGLLFVLLPGSSTPVSAPASASFFADAFDDPTYDGNFNEDLWQLLDEGGSAYQENGVLELRASTAEAQGGIWTDGYLADAEQSFELVGSYRLNEDSIGGLMAVNVGAIAQCVWRPGGTVPGVDCNVAAVPDADNTAVFPGEVIGNRLVRIVYYAPDRAVHFFVDDMNAGQTIALGEAELGTEYFRPDQRIIVRVHDLADSPGGASGAVDWIEFRHLTDDEAQL